MATAEEKAILGKMPRHFHYGNEELDYLSKFLDSKTPEQLSHYSLDFKVAVVEILDLCAGHLEIVNNDLKGKLHSYETTAKLKGEIVYWEGELKERMAKFKETIKKSNDPHEIEKQRGIVSNARGQTNINKRELQERESYEKELKHNTDLLNNIGGYGNKMFAAISSDEIAPTEEQEALKKNPELLLTINQHLEKVAGRMTVKNYKEQLHYCLKSIAKTYGIPIPDIKTVKPGEDGFNPAAGAVAWDNLVELNKKTFFDKNGKFIPGQARWLVSVLHHELMHLKDYQNINNYYQKSEDSVYLLSEQLLKGVPTKHQDTICRLMAASRGELEHYTKSVSLEGANNIQRHDNNPVERRAILAAQTYDNVLAETQQKRQNELRQKLQPEIEKTKLDLARFADAYYVAKWHDNTIDQQDDHYKLLDDKRKNMLHEAVQLTADDKFTEFLHGHPMDVEAFSLYFEGAVNFLAKNPEALKKGIRWEYFFHDPDDKKFTEEWQHKFTPQERTYWENQTRKVGFDAVVHPAQERDRELLKTIIIQSIQSEKNINPPPGQDEHRKPKEDNLKPPLVTTSSPGAKVQVFDPAEAARARDQDSKIVPVFEGSPWQISAAKPLAFHAYGDGDSATKGKALAQTTVWEISLPPSQAAEELRQRHAQANHPSAPVRP